MMDTKTLAVGKAVYVRVGFGPVEGKIVKIVPPCVYVDAANGQFRFNNEGKECDPNGKAYTYEFDPTFGPGPWELSLRDQAETDS